MVAREMSDLINHSLSENILVDLAVDKKKRPRWSRKFSTIR